uniref:Uncharacterized protein n=1 Tax=Oryza meridionalis TaxID=40149 RepID=A0A0E0D5V6_9ORYZ
MPSQRQNPRNVSCRPSPLPDDIVSIPAVSPVISSHLICTRHATRYAPPGSSWYLAGETSAPPPSRSRLLQTQHPRRRGAAWRLVSTHPSLPRSYANAGRRIGYRGTPPPVSLIWFLPLLPFGSRKQRFGAGERAHGYFLPR